MAPRKKTFQQRLKACQQAGNLTTADLQRWFDRPYQTVRSWIDGREPSGGPIDREHANSMLGLLEVLIKQKRGFPMPRLSQAKRIEHMQQVRTTLLSHAS